MNLTRAIGSRIRLFRLSPAADEKPTAARLAGYDILFLLAIALEFSTPLLIRWGLLPGSIRWATDLLLVLMIAGAFARMMVYDRIPRMALLVAAISLIGITVAFFEGQHAAATVWGWWLMFRYPLVGLYVYLRPNWPPDTASHFLKVCFALLGIEVLIQLGQYVTGEVPGDNLAGTFGRHGVAPLSIFLLFVCCLALGRWLASGDLRPLAWAFGLGTISSALGAMKVFPFAAVAVGLIASGIHIVRRGRIRTLFASFAVLVVCATIFGGFYDRFVSDTRGTRPLQSYLDLETLDDYLNSVSQRESDQLSFNLGRNFAVRLGWQAIQGDAATLLFGMGLGSRGESVSLGIIGVGLERGLYGLNAGTSLLIMMQELGMVGLVVLALFILWTAFALYRDAQTQPGSDVAALRYGLLIFTIAWPIWLWYARSWHFSAVMLLYWAAYGYVFRASPSFANQGARVAEGHAAAVLSQEGKA